MQKQAGHIVYRLRSGFYSPMTCAIDGIKHDTRIAKQMRPRLVSTLNEAVRQNKEFANNRIIVRQGERVVFELQLDGCNLANSDASNFELHADEADSHAGTNLAMAGIVLVLTWGFWAITE